MQLYIIYCIYTDYNSQPLSKCNRNSISDDATGETTMKDLKSDFAWTLMMKRTKL